MPVTSGPAAPQGRSNPHDGAPSRPKLLTMTGAGSVWVGRGGEMSNDSGRDEAESVEYRHNTIGKGKNLHGCASSCLEGLGNPLTASDAPTTERGGLSYRSIPAVLNRLPANPAWHTRPSKATISAVACGSRRPRQLVPDSTRRAPIVHRLCTSRLLTVAQRRSNFLFARMAG
jgi:hypothetical protein